MNHALLRALERYGIVLDEFDLVRIKNRIKEKDKAIRLDDAKDGKSLWAVKHNMHWLPMIIAPDGEIVTILPQTRLLKYMKHIPIGQP